MKSSGAAYSGLPQCVCSRLPWWRALLSPKSEKKGRKGGRDSKRKRGRDILREGWKEIGQEVHKAYSLNTNLYILTT